MRFHVGPHGKAIPSDSSIGGSAKAGEANATVVRIFAAGEAHERGFSGPSTDQGEAAKFIWASLPTFGRGRQFWWTRRHSPAISAERDIAGDAALTCLGPLISHIVAAPPRGRDGTLLRRRPSPLRVVVAAAALANAPTSTRTKRRSSSRHSPMLDLDVQWPRMCRQVW